MKICPICNVTIEPNFICSNCGCMLDNKGRVDEYYGPYSADAPIEKGDYCQHFYQCSFCGNVQSYNIKMINF